MGSRRQKLIIYPIGNSDLGFNREAAFPRGQDFRAHLETLRSLFLDHDARLAPIYGEEHPFPLGFDLSAIPESHRKVERTHTQTGEIEPFQINTVQLTMMPRVMQRFYDAASSEKASITWRLQPILTHQLDEQGQNHPQDTSGIEPVLTRFVTEINRRIGGAFPQYGDQRLQLEPSLYIEANPSDYTLMLTFYEQIYQELERLIDESDVCLINVTTGTPAMSFAAGLIFASDTRIHPFYQPRHQDLIYVATAFRDRARAETLKSLRQMLERFDFRGSLQILNSSKTGFDSSESRQAARLFQALSAWQNHDYEQAGELVYDIENRGDAVDQFRRLTAELAQLDDDATGQATGLRIKLIDTVMRLELAVYRQDLPTTLHQFYNYHDVCMAWALSSYFTDLDIHSPKLSPAIRRFHRWFAQRYLDVNKNIDKENGKFQLLCALDEKGEHPQAEVLSKWLKRHELVRWFKKNYVDEQRNRLIHGSAQLQQRLFDEMFNRLMVEDGNSPSQVAKGEGPWLLLGLSYWSHEAIPPQASGLSLDIIQSVAFQAWSDLRRKCEARPPDPEWANWDRNAATGDLVFRRVVKSLEKAFQGKVTEQQQTRSDLLSSCRESVRGDIRRSQVLTEKRRELLLDTLSDVRFDDWSSYAEHGLIGADRERLERFIKKRLIQALHPAYEHYEKMTNDEQNKVIGWLHSHLRPNTDLQFDDLFTRLDELWQQKQA